MLPKELRCSIDLIDFYDIHNKTKQKNQIIHSDMMNAEHNNLQPNEQAEQLKGKQTGWSSYSILIYIIRCEWHSEFISVSSHFHTIRTIKQTGWWRTNSLNQMEMKHLIKNEHALGSFMFQFSMSWKHKRH